MWRTFTPLFSFRTTMLALVSGAAMVALVHCGGDPTADATETPDASGPRSDGATSSADAGGNSLAPGKSHDAGTIDSGRSDTDIEVCGGSKGNPTAVPLLDWSVVASPGKYKVVLGAKSELTEPIAWSDNGAIVTGRVDPATGSTSGGYGGGGPYGSRVMSRREFARFMPETGVSSNLEKNLGYTEALEGVYDLVTNAFDSSKVHRVAGANLGATIPDFWSLSHAVRGPLANDSDYYVDRITPSRGYGWLFTIELDAPCKADALDALVGPNPLDILDPLAPHTRDEVSNFLVDNNAKLSLYVLTFGAEQPGIKAALEGTQASAATLDQLDAAMKGLHTALVTYASNFGPSDYESVAAGTNASWVLGGIHAVPVSSIR